MWPVIGHEWAVELLTSGIETQRLAHAYLFAGPAQVGKGTLAKAFAQALLCADRQAPCGTCRSCRLVHTDRHPDVQVIAPENDRIKIETIRSMQRSVALSPIEGRYRIWIISRIDQATTSAANALLKTLEEPPLTVILLLTANRIESVLPTIASRCQTVSLRVLPRERIVSALRMRNVDDDQSRLLGHLAQGRIGWALAAAKDARVLEKRARIIENMLVVSQGSYVDRFAWAQKLSKMPTDVSHVLQVLGSWWRDVLLLSSKSTTPIANIDQEAELVRWATQYDAETARKALQAIHHTALRLERNANVRLALEVLMLDLPGGVPN